MSSSEVCVLCGIAPAVGQGEHIWPSWYLKYLDRLGSPVSGWSQNEVPITDREGAQIHPARRMRVLIPACESCNAELNRRFEVPAKPIIKRLAAKGWAGPATAEEWHIVGLWFAKILLLLGNPRARYEHPHVNEKAIRFEAGEPDISWLINQSPPPEGLSLWVFNASRNLDDRLFRVAVPRAVRTADGGTVPFHFMMVTLEGLSVTLLSHAGWPVEHPLVERGQAWELLHTPPSGDLSLLPRLSYQAVFWRAFTATLAEGAQLGGDLPPLRASEALVPPEIMTMVANAEF